MYLTRLVRQEARRGPRTGYSSARASMHLPFETPPETFQFGCSDWPKVQMSEAGNQNAS